MLFYYGIALIRCIVLDITVHIVRFVIAKYTGKKIIEICLLPWSHFLVEGDKMLIFLEMVHIVCQ